MPTGIRRLPYGHFVPRTLLHTRPGRSTYIQEHVYSYCSERPPCTVKKGGLGEKERDAGFYTKGADYRGYYNCNAPLGSNCKTRCTGKPKAFKLGGQSLEDS